MKQNEVCQSGKNNHQIKNSNNTINNGNNAFNKHNKTTTYK